MKPAYSRRYRRSRNTSRSEGAFFKTESGEQAFFDTPAPAPFFTAAPAAIQRKCDKCDEEKKNDPIAMNAPAKAAAPAMEAEKKKEAPVEGEKKKEEDKKLHRKEDGAPAMTAAPFVSNLSGGTKMPASLNYFYASRIGRNFSDVSIHTDAAAASSAKSLNAKAYTIGNHIVFNEGRFQPQTEEGRKLLAHELAHVAQQDSRHLNRKTEADTDDISQGDMSQMEEELPSASTFGMGTSTANKIAFGNCAGVHVQGRTTANYDHGSYSVSGATVTRATNCSGCAGDDCVTIRGTIASVFQANPTVSLPGVPSGLNACEQQAVQNFISTTLSQHEQLHVNAFNTYNATINTPFTYTGCRDGMDGYVSGIHNGIDVSRIASANALSDALDRNGANNFTITCNCPDPVAPDAGRSDAGRDAATPD